ncbi:MAG TPA: TIGR01777 family oxidoreductase [Pyrinomonadaceae bacterium]|nr:TIGR01777 family oxidoreductase [Pyrinomonadaceae bacterium]
MKIVIPGGSGYVGTVLARALHASGHDVVVLTRAQRSLPWRTVDWDGETLGKWADEFEAADAIINLAGQSVNCRYTRENRRIITESRLKSTKVVGDAIACAWTPPRVWLQASTATIYAHRYDAPNDEATGIIGGAEPNAPNTWRFSIDVATSWEQALKDSPTPNTRRVAMRTAIVMHPDHGSPFDILLRLVRFGLGGQAGDGRQYMSWIHERDFIRAVLWLIEHEHLEGPVNLAAPQPLPNAEFMQALREAWGHPFGLPSPKPVLELGAWLCSSETELILKSRRVVPARLLQSGFEFDFPSWPEAARELVKRSQHSNYAAENILMAKPVSGRS